MTSSSACLQTCRLESLNFTSSTVARVCRTDGVWGGPLTSHLLLGFVLLSVPLDANLFGVVRTSSFPKADPRI